MKAFYRYCGIAVLAAVMCLGAVGCGSETSTTSSINTEEAKKAQQAQAEELKKEKQEKVDFLYRFIDTKKQKYDQAQQITWVDSVDKQAFGHKGIYTYMGIKGKDKKGEKWLRADIHYSGSDWVFFDKVTFSNTEESWTYHISEMRMLSEKDDDVVWGGVHESIDVPFGDIRAGLVILTKGKNPRIDFYGQAGHSYKQITAAELKNIKTYLKLEEGIEAEKSL